jgi:hypothetical protein
LGGGGGFTVSGNLQTYLVGPRASFKTQSPIKPFAEVLIGLASGTIKGSGGGVTITGPRATGFAVALGGGLDWKVNRHFSVRPVQFDYLMTRFGNSNTFTDVNGPRPGDGGNGTQNNFRYTAGVVYNF